LKLAHPQIFWRNNSLGLIPTLVSITKPYPICARQKSHCSHTNPFDLPFEKKFVGFKEQKAPREIAAWSLLVSALTPLGTGYFVGTSYIALTLQQPLSSPLPDRLFGFVDPCRRRAGLSLSLCLKDDWEKNAMARLSHTSFHD